MHFRAKNLIVRPERESVQHSHIILWLCCLDPAAQDDVDGHDVHLPEQLALRNQCRSAASAISEVMFWLRAMIFIPNARPIPASRSSNFPRNWPTEFAATASFSVRLARFRQIDLDNAATHHDALEFPDGQVILLTRLCEGQRATVLQLPAVPRTAEEAGEQKRVSVVV